MVSVALGGGQLPQPLYNSNLLADVLLRTNLAVLLLDSFLSSLLVITSSALFLPLQTADPDDVEWWSKLATFDQPGNLNGCFLN